MNTDEVRRQVIEILSSKKYKSETVNGLGAHLRLDAAEWPKLAEIVATMECEGLLLITKNGRVQGAKEAGIMAGVMRNLTKTGGFASLADGSGDTFIKKQYLEGAMPSDIVVLKPVRRGGSLPEA
ncbi:MAG: hypothetical protein P4L75_04175, partial [Clostridia bacterium]|nr:hypothetical protein [Clostridia bacterium]